MRNSISNSQWRVCQNENYRSITPPSRLLSQPPGGGSQPLATAPSRCKAVEGFMLRTFGTVCIAN